MANFTEYFSEYLKTHTIPDSLSKFPNDTNGKTFSQRFQERNYYKEIGSETEELFEMHLSIKSDECVSNYLWKVELFNSNYQDLLSRVATANNSYTETNGGEDKKYHTHEYNETKEDKHSGSDSRTDNTTTTGTLSESQGGKDNQAQTHGGTDTTANTNGQYYNPINLQAGTLSQKTTTDETKNYGETIDNTTFYGKTISNNSNIGEDTKSQTTYGETINSSNITNDTSEDITSYGKTNTRTSIEQRVNSYTKSNPEIMKAMFDLNTIYEEALAFLDVLFMVIL